MSSISRSIILISVSISIAIVGTVRLSADADTEPVRIQLQWYPQAQFAGFVMAEKKGLFKKNGIPEVELLWGGTGIGPFDRLAKGEADFCTGWLSQGITRRAAGEPIVEICQILRQSSMLFVVRADSGITGPGDISGRTIGLWGGDFDAICETFFEKFDISPKPVTQSASVAPFLRGAVDVASAMRYNEYHSFLMSGIKPEELRVFAFSELDLDFPEDGIFCRESIRRAKPDLCRAVVDSVRQGWRYCVENERETLDALLQVCREHGVVTNINHQRWMLKTIVGAMNDPAEPSGRWGRLNPKAFDQVAESLLNHGVIKAAPPYGQFFQPPPTNKAVNGE